MESIAVLIGLFWLGLVSPGPNFLVLARNSMVHGARFGFITGLGMATGDAIYAGAGLWGMDTLVREAGFVFLIVRTSGGLYLLYLGLRLLFGREPSLQAREWETRTDRPALRFFVAGLVTDLANPKTVVFFASIFAVVLTPATSLDLCLGMAASVVVVSVVWRSLLAVLFSRAAVRRAYARWRAWLDRVCGAALSVIGTRLVLTN